MVEHTSRTQAADLEAAADRAASNRDPATARWLLEQLVSLDPDRAEPWMKLAAMCRMQEDPEAALHAVTGALRVEPLGFLALLMKARLLQGLGRIDEAGETFGYALAQRPDKVPPQLQAALAEAEEQQRAFAERQRARLEKGAALLSLSDSERSRLARFRTNIVRETRPYHSEPTHFYYPGLVEREFHEIGDFPWAQALRAATDAIAADFERVVIAERAELVPYVQYPDDLPLRQWEQLNHNRAWTAIHLLRNGEEVAANARHCPATMEVLRGIELAAIPGFGPNAMFSLLAPGAHIPPHNGVANVRLVSHLPLMVPPRCWFRVGAETRAWRRGEPWVFDDTIEHEAANESDALRVVLIFDVWHPQLSDNERQAVSETIRASGIAPAASL
ncbi:MAG TPA: aspartyl/asparaginyl beta-hydroxylase domain-containing protein [Allosphingosinicella sp.]|nr:aspartyl/asparaginyl beta-hydroxylase domain-containing protein [Allosphingosinicella sp.]